MLSPLIPIDCLVYLSGLLHLSRYVTMTSNETCHSKAMDSFHIHQKSFVAFDAYSAWTCQKPMGILVYNPKNHASARLCP